MVNVEHIPELGVPPPERIPELGVPPPERRPEQPPPVTVPPPVPSKPKPPPPGARATPSQVPQWVEQLADVLALITTAFFIMQAGSWAGKDNWIVALAMGAAAWFLVGNYNGPVRQWLRAIFTELLLTIVTLVEAVGQFFTAAGRYYNGNFARMVLEVILVPLALRALGELLGYGAVRDLLTFVTQMIDGVRDFAEKATNFVAQGIADLRTLVVQNTKDLLAFIPQELDRFRGQITADLDRVFVAAERRVARVEDQLVDTRTALVSFVNSATAAVHLRVDLLGHRVDLMPQTVRNYLTATLIDQVQDLVSQPSAELPAGPAIPAVAREALARLTDELTRTAAGEETKTARVVGTAIAAVDTVASTVA